MIPGEIEFNGPDIVINAGRPVTMLNVKNIGDRPIQVGSHYHFAEVNPHLEFRLDGEPVPHTAARGLRLHIKAGTSVRFETNCDDDVPLVPLAGNRVVPGLRGETRGPVDGNGNRGQDDE
ncbi:urease subunit beta [Streptomyces sp. MspMP-M5]|uniref:urease subunit beta n=1 Tax=unclassified Streptomyces TaxID=2593676 RepID=UPI0003AA88D3|nr:urease subunit beta [Streptomyces sp. MspMP-M5]MYT32801.1 urease subunit beta [Streptomyces sp. SID8354]